MPNWRLAKSLTKLRDQINAAHPARSKASDGSIGDERHQRAGTSDHLPNEQGVVTAIDITVDPEHGVDGHSLSRALAQDKRVKYVIFNSQIFRSYKPQLGWTPYKGSNAHAHHVHVSVLAQGYDDETPWFKGLSPATLRRGDSGSAVMELQHKLGIKEDGKFGPDTEHALREFQAHHNLKVDGIAGSETNAILFGGK